MFEFPHIPIDLAGVVIFNEHCGKSVFLDSLGLVFLSVDSIRTAILVAFIIGIWEFGRVKKDTNSLKRVLAILLSIVLTLSVIEIMNAIIESPRPIVTYGDQINPPIVEDRHMKHLWRDGWVRNSKHGSFPSDTVALLASMACGIFLWNRTVGFFAFLFLIFGGIIPRLYFGLHYPSDMLIGTLIAVISTLLIDKLKFLESFYLKILEINEKFPYVFGVCGFYLFYIIADKFILLRKLPLWIEAMLGS